MRGVLEWIETDAADPLCNQAGVLPGGQKCIRTPAAWEQALPRFTTADTQIVIQCLPRNLRHFEPDWSTRFLLAHVGAAHGIAVGRHVIDPQRHEIAPA